MSVGTLRLGGVSQLALKGRCNLGEGQDRFDATFGFVIEPKASAGPMGVSTHVSNTTRGYDVRTAGRRSTRSHRSLFVYTLTLFVCPPLFLFSLLKQLMRVTPTSSSVYRHASRCVPLPFTTSSWLAPTFLAFEQ